MLNYLSYLYTQKRAIFTNLNLVLRDPSIAPVIDKGLELSEGFIAMAQTVLLC